MKLISINQKTAILGMLAATITASSASITVDTVGVINPRGRTISEATDNSLTVTTFATTIADAFANNTGGVWNFDGPDFDVTAGETITLNFGTSLTNSLVLTMSGAPTGIDQSTSMTQAADETTSGDYQMGLAGTDTGTLTRTFTPDTPLLTVGIFSTDRNDATRVGFLTVTYQDTTTASTSGANANNAFFHGLSGTVDNPIVSFSLSQNNYVRYDDLGFVVVPEPSAALLGGFGLLALLRRRR